MSDDILCPDCGHDIDDHQTFETAKSRDFPCRVPPCECWNEPSTIARAYADERVREAMDSHRCDEQAERAYLRAVTSEADARRLHSVRDEVAVEAARSRQAHRSCRVDHFAHDYCRWVGMSEAYHNVLNILDRRDDD